MAETTSTRVRGGLQRGGHESSGRIGYIIRVANSDDPVQMHITRLAHYWLDRG
jgi:hypothetical protein